MHAIPDLREEVADDVAQDSRRDDERDGRTGVKVLHDVRQTDHVRPEEEIDEHLSYSERNENRPEDMQAADEHSDGKRGLGGINVVFHNGYIIQLISSYYPLGREGVVHNPYFLPSLRHVVLPTRFDLVVSVNYYYHFEHTSAHWY